MSGSVIKCKIDAQLLAVCEFDRSSGLFEGSKPL